MELVNLVHVFFEEEISFDLHHLNKMDRLRDLHNVIVKGEGHYDCSSQRFEVDLNLAGDMIVPCAVTLEDVVVPFEITSHEIFSFQNEEDEEIHSCKKDFLELYPVIFQLIMAEVPLKVVKEDAAYPKGDGWEVLSEEEYRIRSLKEIDPRLAKLKEFKFEEN